MLSLLSIIGAVSFANEGYYTRSEQYVIENTNYWKLRSDSHYVLESVLYRERSNEQGYPFAYDAYTPDESNIRYMVVSPEGETVGSNISDVPEEWKYSFTHYAEIDEYGYLYSINYGSYVPTEQENLYTVYMYLEEGLPVSDYYSLSSSVIHILYSLKYAVYPIGIVSFILFIVFFVTLMSVSARKPDSDELHPGLLNRVPFDILLAISATILIFFVAMIDNTPFTDEFVVALVAILAVFAVSVILGLCMSFAARLKQRELLKNTAVWIACKHILRFIRWVARKIKNLFMSIPLIWRTLLIVAGDVVLDMIIFTAMSYYGDEGTLLWIFKKILVFAVAVYAAIFMRKLQAGGEALAKGDLDYQIDTKTMFWDFKRHGENLNCIAEGMAVAVEERLQSERMKAELITNVSHDIKTPLTSIINYASLIADEECGSEQHKEYSEVLLRKSEHLKRLLDDLVEISKATTGNLDVAMRPCDAGVLLTQVAGEFEQKCKGAALELITSMPECNIRIMADSRRIWRVFENLMNNACKYSLTGSRVYLTLAEEDGDALFIFRNTSKTALNISPDELMERFVRGDTSRSTDGNGLGLSIAGSLTELQNGKMNISIDGDLFKVTLRFPKI